MKVYTPAFLDVIVCASIVEVVGVMEFEGTLLTGGSLMAAKFVATRAKLITHFQQCFDNFNLLSSHETFHISEKHNPIIISSIQRTDSREKMLSFRFCQNYLPLPPIWTTCTIFPDVEIQDLKVSLGLLCIYNLK